MTHSENLSEADLFKKMVMVSAILHVSIFLVLGVKALIFPSEKIDLDAAIRVDMVALPDKIQQLPEATPEPAPQPPAKVVETKEEKPPAPKPKPVVLKPKTNSKQKIIKEFERAEKRRKSIEDIEQDLKKQEAEEKAERQRKAREALVKGNVVNTGSSLKGLAKLEFNEYVARLNNHIKSHWNLPEWLQNDSLKAVVIVFIDFRGVVVKRLVEKSSGDPRFDDFALKAVDESSPFPQPPGKFVDLVRERGIALGFPQ